MNLPAKLMMAATLLLGGCAAAPEKPLHDPRFAPVAPQPAIQAPENAGGIYQPTAGLGLYEDITARQVGDILTVQVVEQTNASKQASTSTSKDQSLDMGAGTLFGTTPVYNGNNILQNSIQAQRSFGGEGASSQSNSLQGSITVTVAQVLANGNLMVRGEKVISLNQGDEFVRFSGIVRPVDIRADNSVLSTKVANAQIVYGGTGALADANQQGWLARFFNSGLWPF